MDNRQLRPLAVLVYLAALAGGILLLPKWAKGNDLLLLGVILGNVILFPILFEVLPELSPRWKRLVIRKAE